MTNKRSYKEAMTKQQAIEEIKYSSWSQFDPILVRKFIEVLESETC